MPTPCRQRTFTFFFGSDGEAHHVVTDWAAPSLSRTAYIASAVVSMDAQASGKGPGAVRQIKKGGAETGALDVKRWYHASIAA